MVSHDIFENYYNASPSMSKGATWKGIKIMNVHTPERVCITKEKKKRKKKAPPGIFGFSYIWTKVNSKVLSLQSSDGN